MSKGKILSKSIQEMIDEIRKARGSYEAKRLERAADEVPNLGRLYQERALENLFRGDNAAALMTMRPGDFERYATPLDYSPTGLKTFMFGELAGSKGQTPKGITQEEYLRYLANLSGFEDVPFLDIDRANPKHLPNISGHEGRHRMRALEKKGQPTGLVRLLPRASIREDLPRRTREEAIEALRKELGDSRLVTPQGSRKAGIDETEGTIALPDVYKQGGPVHKQDGGSIKASPAKPGQQFLGRLGQVAEKLGIKLEEAMKIVAQEGNSPVKAFLVNMLGSETLKSAGTALQDWTGTPRDATEDYPYRRLVTGKGMTAQFDPRLLDVAPIAGAAASRVAGAMKNLPTDVMRAATAAYGPRATASPMDVWHGSPHKFDAFDSSKIGTGEGAQAYGHGLYFAESPGVAKSYRDKLSDGFTFPGGTKLDSSALTDMGFKTPQIKAIISSLNLHQGDVAKASQTIRGNASYLRYGSAEQNSLQKAADFVSGIKANELPSSGSLYKVDLPDEQIAKMLDWDKPLSEQPEIQKALKGTDYEVGISNKEAEKIADMRLRQEADEWADETGGDPVDYINNANWDKYVDDARKESGNIDSATTGAELHRMIMKDEGYRPQLFDPENYQVSTSEYLRSMGIPGIKYLDASSRDAGEGTSNFVVFPGGEEMLTIKERMKDGGKVKKPVSIDAMRLAVGGMAGGGIRRRGIEEVTKLFEAAQKTRSRAAQEAAGLYHPIGGGVKLSQPVELMTSKTVADPSVRPVKRRIITPEDMQGGIALPLIGDRAAAGRILTEVGGQRLSKPVNLQGGPGFMQTHTQPVVIPLEDKSAAWASGQGVISRLSGLAQRAAELGGTDKIYAPYVAMSPTGVDFNAMVAQTVLNQYDPSALTKKAKKEFLNDVRNYVPDKKKPHIKPGSVLTEADLNDVEALREKMLSPDAGPLRKVFVQRMGTNKFQNQGFPNVAAARAATTEPELMDIDVGSTGHNIALINPEGKIIESPKIPHETYPVQLSGEYFGSLEQPVSYKEFFPGYVEARRALGKPEKDDWYTFGRSMPLQQLDQEWVDRMMKSSKNPREWKKGGAVKKAEGGAATINEAMLRRERRLGKVDKPVSIPPKQLARGWAAGTLGLPGDIESLGRAVIPGVSEETFLPTSEDVLKKIPGAATDETGQRAAQVGTLFGGAGAGRIANAMKYLPTDVMRAAVEAYGPQATAAHVIKPKGGNWLAGEVEGRLKSLKTGSPDQVAAINDPNAPGGVRYEKQPENPLNQWIDKQLTRYVKNEMGTPEDPIRKIAETGKIHVPPTYVYEIFDPSQLMAKRLSVGMPVKGMGQSQMAKGWEEIVDRAIEPSSAGSYVYGALDEDILKKNPWLSKVDPEAMVYYAKGLPRDVGFDHLIDELKNALDPNSGLPRNLQLKPESLSRLSVPQAVERVAKINEWRAAQKAEADIARANNPATVTVKEYPEGFKWAELKSPGMPTGLPEGWSEPVMKGNALQTKSPSGDIVLGFNLTDLIKNIYERHPETPGSPRQALQDALKYEGETMGHCVGGYCPDVMEGRSRIYSLRDSKGQPHVTVEVEPPSIDDYVAANQSTPYQPALDRIVQIKGKGNAKPADKYLPFVQDFVRSGKWSDIGDFKNTDLYRKSDFIDEFTPEQLDSAGKGEYLTIEEIRNLREGKQWKPIDTDPDLDINIDNLGMKRGGPVSMDAMRLAVMDKNLRKQHG